MQTLVILYEPNDFGGDNPFTWKFGKIGQPTEGLNHPSNRDFQYDFFYFLYQELFLYFDRIYFNSFDDSCQDLNLTFLVVNRPNVIKKNDSITKAMKNSRRCFLIATEEELYLQQVYKNDYLSGFAGFFSHRSAGEFNLACINGFTRKRLINSKLEKEFGSRNLLVGCVAANKYNNHTGACYLLRQTLIDQYRKILGERFALRGYGWRYLVLHRPTIFGLNRVFNIIARRIPLPFRRDLRLNDKKHFLRTCDFTLVVENYKMENVNYVTEKLFDSLVAGSVPIYYGPKIDGRLMPESFVVYPQPSGKVEDVVAKISQISRQDLLLLRTKIYEWLLHDDSNNFENEANARKLAKCIANQPAQLV